MARQGRFLDPMARATSFAARKGGMRDDRQSERRMRRVERDLYGSQSDESGESPDGWSMIEEVAQQPTPTADVIGRMFVQRNVGADDTLSVGITAADGTPILIGLTTQSPDDAAVALALEAALSAGYETTGVAIDASAGVYVAQIEPRITKYNASLVSQWTVGLGDRVEHISCDGTYVYMARSASALIQRRLLSTGASPTTIGTVGTGAGQFQGPHGVANNATHLWVTDRVRNKVIKFTLAGAYVSEFGATGSAQGQFSGPTGVALDLTGNIYVCDTGNNRIQKFDSAGTWLATYGGSAGNGDGQFLAPEGIAVDDSGNMWIADTGNHRIQVLDSAGVYVSKVGSYGSGSGQLNSPKDIALGVGYGYVADYGNKRISRVKVAAEHTHENVVTMRSTTGAVIANGGAENIVATCNADEIVTGGGYVSLTTNNGQQWFNSRPTSTTQWTCTWRNATGGNAQGQCYAVCLKKVI